MKTILCFIFLFSFPVIVVFGQNCRVMTERLQGKYDGNCKNGLAHGKGSASGLDSYTGSFKSGVPDGRGIYTWSTGEKYDGEWKQGMRVGSGTYSCTINGKDTIYEGIWKGDKYMGPKPMAPKVMQSYNVLSTSFIRKGDENKIDIMFTQNGMPNIVESLDIVTSSGRELTTGKIITFYDLIFPFHCKLSYVTMNSLKTVSYNCSLEFEITEAGSWELRIGN